MNFRNDTQNNCILCECACPSFLPGSDSKLQVEQVDRFNDHLLTLNYKY